MRSRARADGGVTASAPSSAVLLAGEDGFEAGYVKAVLAARGIAVIGPFPSEGDAISAIDPIIIRAAVVAHDDRDDSGLLEQLGRRGIPYLVLTRSAEVAEGRPSLARPFAAYQVADWVVTTPLQAEIVEQPLPPAG